MSHLPHGASTRQECFLRDSYQSFQLQFQHGQVIQEFRDWALLDAHYGVQQICEDLSLDPLVCAGQVGLNMAKKYLDGTRTRTSILNKIVDWINRTDPTAIFWLHGQAGKGKSAIAHTVALQARNLGVVGSCFCRFARVRQHEGLHTRLFPTIARDLVGHDFRLRLVLAQVISNDHSLRDTADIAMQWQRFSISSYARFLCSLNRRAFVQHFLLYDTWNCRGWCKCHL